MIMAIIGIHLSLEGPQSSAITEHSHKNDAHYSYKHSKHPYHKIWICLCVHREEQCHNMLKHRYYIHQRPDVHMVSKANIATKQISTTTGLKKSRKLSSCSGHKSVIIQELLQPRHELCISRLLEIMHNFSLPQHTKGISQPNRQKPSGSRSESVYLNGHHRP